jgi:hypothetical protein
MMATMLRFSVLLCLLCLWAGVAAAQVAPQNPNLFLATPNTGTGYLGLRAITPQDFNSGTGASGSTCLSGLMTWIACNGASGINTGAQGQIAYYAAAGTTLSPLAAGTAGQFLQSSGAGAAPVWATSTGSFSYLFEPLASQFGAL